MFTLKIDPASGLLGESAHQQRSAIAGLLHDVAQKLAAGHEIAADQPIEVTQPTGRVHVGQFTFTAK